MRRLSPFVSLAAIVSFVVIPGGGPAEATRDQNAPQSLVAPAVVGNPAVGAIVSVTLGSWSGKGIRFTEQWLRCDQTGAGCSSIPSANATSYVVVTPDAYHTLRASVTATNRTGTATATSAPTSAIPAVAVPAPVDQSPPTAPSAVSVGSTTQTAATVSWAASTDDVGVSTYRVYLGSALAGATAATSFTLTGLTCSTAFSAGVEAVDAAGNVSARGSVSGRTATCPTSTSRTLVFADDFDTLDTKTWTNGLWGYDSFDPANLASVDRLANDTTSGGVLSLTAHEQSASTSWPGYGGKVYPYTTGGISSDPAHATTGFAFTYGLVEARVKVPAGKGLWPAFWLLSQGGEAGQGEIDAMEILGDTPSVLHMNYHGAFNQGSSYVAPASLAAGFHTYAVDWQPGSIVWYLDGVERYRITDSRVTSTPHYLILNLAVGASTSWPGAPDWSTAFPSAAEVDWVHVYR
jgi:beta-glucanase (GH16 family)